MEKIHMIGCDAVHPSDFVYDVPPHHAALFTPECRIHYRAAGELYRNDWMIFWSDEPYVTQFPRTGEPFAVTDPEYDHTLFQLLTWEHNQNNYEMVISQLMSVLFQKLSADLKTPAMDEYSLLLQSVHRAVMSNPEKDWTVSEIAALCGYHSAEHFSRQFHKACGVSPGQFRKQPLDVPEQ